MSEGLGGLALAEVMEAARRLGRPLEAREAARLLGLGEGVREAPGGAWGAPGDAWGGVEAAQARLEAALPPEPGGRVQIFTPRWAARWMASAAIRSGGARVLDPAAGSGRLLLAALDRLVDALGATPEAALGQVMGLEVSAEVACVGRASLLLWALARGVVPEALPVEVGDALTWPAWPACDAVLLNPPYANADVLPEATHAALAGRVPGYQRQVDQSAIFVTLGAQALSPGGRLAALTARYWLEAKRAEGVRGSLASAATLEVIWELGEAHLWPGVQVLTALVVLRASPPAAAHLVVAGRWGGSGVLEEAPELEGFAVLQRGLGAGPWRLRPPGAAAARRPMEEAPLQLGAWFAVGQGVKTGHNATFVVSEADAARLPARWLRPTLASRHIQAGWLAPSGQRLLLILNGDDPLEEPALRAWLEARREALEARYQVRDGSARWYALSMPQGLGLMERSEKVVAPLYAQGNRFAVDRAGSVLRTDAWALAPEVVLPVPLEAVVAALNSAPLTRFALESAKRKRAGYYEYSRETLARLPLPWTPEGEVLPGAPGELVEVLLGGSEAERDAAVAASFKGR